MFLTRRSLKRLSTSVIVTALFLALWGVVLFTEDVREEMDRLAIANSDSLQWSLSQFEVEYLQMSQALDSLLVQRPEAQRRPGQLDNPSARRPSSEELAPFIRRFDIFYARVSTVMDGYGFAEVIDKADVQEELARLRSFTETTAALVDAGPETLGRNLVPLRQSLSALASDIRAVSLEGVRTFTTQAKVQRERVHTALLRLAGLTVGLLTALTAGIFALWGLWDVGQSKTRALASAKLRLESVIETALDAVIVVDEDMRVVEFNAAAEATFGYSKAEALGHDLAELIIPTQFVAAHLAAVRRYRETGLRTLVGSGLKRLQARRKDGSRFPVELSISATSIGRKEIFVSYLRDITERVAAERELVSARDRAMAGERAKAAFVAVMSHEMRTPLSALLGTLDNLRATKLSAKQTRFVHAMEQAGEILAQHVNDVLDLERLEAGQLELKRDAFDPWEIAEQVVETIQAEAEAKGNALAVSGTEGLRLEGDAGRIRQVLVNLTGNANKFTHNGRIDIEIDYRAKAEELVIRVHDSGIGIAKADLERIFDDFVSLNASIGAARAGTGLGLGIARRMVRAMGGRIGVESEEGKGSVFWFALPAQPARSDSEAQPPAPVEAVPLRVMVAEDSELNREMLCEMLRRSGHSIATARNGAEAIELAMRQAFDVILMDVNMPEVSGIEATAAIRSLAGPNKETPIITVSANVTAEDEMRATLAGVSGALRKPISKLALDRMLAGLCVEEAAEGLLDLPTLTELRDMLGAQKFEQMCIGFLAEGARYIPELHQAAQQQDLHHLAKSAHRFAGSSALFGVMELRETLVALENAALSGEPSAAIAPLNALGKSWEESAKALAEWLAKQ